MRHLTLGIVAGLALAVVIRHWLIVYSEHSLPKPDHVGPKFYTWHHGALVAKGTAS